MADENIAALFLPLVLVILRPLCETCERSCPSAATEMGVFYLFYGVDRVDWDEDKNSGVSKFEALHTLSGSLATSITTKTGQN